MNRIKASRKPLALLLAVILALVLWAAWYSRPVDIYTLAPGMETPDYMDITLWELGENRKEYPDKNLTPEDPGWDAALEAAEALRFRRPPWNAVLQFIPERRATGRSVHDGDLHMMIYMGQQRANRVRMQFFIDEWMYYSPYVSRNLTLWTTNPRQTANTFAEAVRPLLDEP